MSEKSGQASLSAVPLKLTNSIPEWGDLKSEREFSVLHGNTEYSKMKYTPSNLSISNVSVNCSPPSADTMIHPIAWKKATWQLVLSITNGSGGNLTNILGTAAAPLIALRDHPLDQILQNEELKINGNSFSVSQPCDFVDAMYRFANSVDDKVNEYSLTPNQMDEFYNYTSATLTNKSPFGVYGGLQIGESRASFNCDYSPLLGIALNNAATATLTFTFTVMEAIKISLCIILNTLYMVLKIWFTQHNLLIITVCYALGLLMQG